MLIFVIIYIINTKLNTDIIQCRNIDVFLTLVHVRTSIKNLLVHINKFNKNSNIYIKTIFTLKNVTQTEFNNL